MRVFSDRAPSVVGIHPPGLFKEWPKTWCCVHKLLKSAGEETDTGQ